ncbi:arylamine N-acetyltransferase family protein [Staphylococcus epidermidis]|uniref:arylamine N-acetyltransferase family protein n=1 Tax=Staphylococcus epidermidis TaxID=1282 RepID=UPI0022E85D27|nr:arylamine N-acetyltransferase [Staphylococcus epidermidis]
MDIQKFESYLKIKHSYYSNPSLEALNYYVRRFMITVPFENINVQNKIPISIDIKDLYNKIVIQRRGGFCYELNHLFATYLEHKGFHVTRAAATVYTPNGGRSPEGSHMSLYVNIEGTLYITDVGFGDLPTSIIEIGSKTQFNPTYDKNGVYRAVWINDNQYALQKLRQNKWMTLYEAHLKSQSIKDFEDKISYNEHHPHSIFVRHLLITQPQSFGRATMTYHSLTLSNDSTKHKYDITTNNYKYFLKKYFNLNVSIIPFEP